MRAFIGTSGYNYDEWAGSFYPEKLAKTKRLPYYAARFPSVEINYSFYRLPSEKTLAGWAAQTPDGFRFVLKAWQVITHQMRLAGTAEQVALFHRRAATLGDKLGPVLYQLPPNLKKDAARLHAFLEELPAGARAAFEFRHESWFDDDTFRALRDHGAALCVAESEDLATPLVATAPFGYFRLRRQDYERASLAKWADRIRSANFSDGVYVFFKHEESATGPAWAADMRALLG
jgi:uncharacterized protein YecE (DUF72 family)